MMVCSVLFSIQTCQFFVQIRNILKEYDEKYLMGSLDEAYMDITIYLKKREESGPGSLAFLA